VAVACEGFGSLTSTILLTVEQRPRASQTVRVTVFDPCDPQETTSVPEKKTPLAPSEAW
jgi:hypothetical protein